VGIESAAIVVEKSQGSVERVNRHRKFQKRTPIRCGCSITGYPTLCKNQPPLKRTIKYALRNYLLQMRSRAFLPPLVCGRGRHYFFPPMPRSIDSRLDFLSPVSLIPGLGPKRAAALHESGIDTLGDLLYHFPLRYINRSIVTPIAELPAHIGEVCTIIGSVTRTRVERGGKTRLRIQITDESGAFEALWFQGVALFRRMLHTGMRVLCTGAVKPDGRSAGEGVQMIHPMLETIGPQRKAPDVPFLPHYSLTGSMIEASLRQKTLFKAIGWVLDNIKHYPQVLPSAMERKKQFPPLQECLREMHTPADPGALDRFRGRIIYEELYRLAVSLKLNKSKFAQPGRSMRPGAMVETFRRLLPFSLTPEQERAMTLLHADAAKPARMHRLLQGDVGSGKTIVAFFACLPALEAGMQVAWLVPTEVLAQQAFSLLSGWCAGLGVAIGLLMASVPVERKKNLINDCASGRLRCVVGTHALMQPRVVFKRLGMIVIDEQHKFGAGQRLSLQEKDLRADFLLMSATPIPQTLASTLYGDLDVVTIRGLPSGRLPAGTHCVSPERRADMENFLRREILDRGAQLFYVVPRIDAGDEAAGSDLRSAADVFASLVRGKFSDIPCGLVHGAMDGGERQRTMEAFTRGEIKVLVATTIIEVGIDVPDATIMVIENAERFGLSQLHQLRGRVGRSSKRAYCFVFSGRTENDASRERLDFFCNHHDGFVIAEKDLLMRGPGEVAGMRQTGWDDLKMADILRDAALFQEILRDLERGV
jgi:ATP-dependent DNA helicase RecG